MLTKKQKYLRNISKLLFAVIFVMIVAGQFIHFSAQIFVYYYAAIAFLTLLAFLFILWDIYLLRKSILKL